MNKQTERLSKLERNRDREKSESIKYVFKQNKKYNVDKETERQR
jgi:hypothetical protein